MKDYSVQCDDLDVQSFHECQKQLSDSGEPQGWGAKFEPADSLSQDFYSLLYKANPRDNEDFEGDQRVPKIVEALRLSPNYDRLREGCRFDELYSTATACSLVHKVVSKMTDSLDKVADNDTSLDDVADTDAAAVRFMLNESIDEAHEEVESMRMAVGLMAGDEEAPLLSQDYSLTQVKSLAKLVKDNEKYRKMLEWVGKMKPVAHEEQRSKLSHGVDEIYDIEQGNSVGRLLPTEFFKLKRCKQQFYKEFSEKQLLQYSLRGGSEPLGKGPVVLILDNSGSMSKDDRYYWARAILLVLHELCLKQKRDLHVVAFNASVQFSGAIQKDGVIEGKALMSILQSRPSGGTNFITALNSGVDLLKDYSSESKKPDLLMVTDGNAPLTPEWKDEFIASKHQLDFNLYSFVIGQPVQDHGMFEISDHTQTIDDLDDASVYANLFNV